MSSHCIPSPSLCFCHKFIYFNQHSETFLCNHFNCLIILPFASFFLYPISLVHAVTHTLKNLHSVSTLYLLFSPAQMPASCYHFPSVLFYFFLLTLGTSFPSPSIPPSMRFLLLINYASPNSDPTSFILNKLTSSSYPSTFPTTTHNL